MNARRTRRVRQPRTTSDAEIMARLAQGEIDALGELYDRYRATVHRFLSRATAGSADVDDLVHATFLSAAKSAAAYDPERATCKAWLIGIAVQHSKRRKTALGRFFEVISSLGGLRRSEHDPESALNAKTDIERALRGLSESKRITFLMAEAEELSCREIAAILGIPIGTVWTRLHASRRELREILDADDERRPAPPASTPPGGAR